MMPCNEEGFRPKQFCAWVPYVDYSRKRERKRKRERERERESECERGEREVESTVNRLYHKGNEKVRMHEQCMII